MNEITGLYERKSVKNTDELEVPVGTTLRLAIPKGENSTVTINGRNAFGDGVLLYWQGTGNVAAGSEHCNGSADSGEYFKASEKLIRDADGITVTFKTMKADYTLELVDNYEGGRTTNVYFTDANDNSAVNYVKGRYTLTSPSTRMGYTFLGWAESTDGDVKYTTPYEFTTPGSNDEYTDSSHQTVKEKFFPDSTKKKTP